MNNDKNFKPNIYDFIYYKFYYTTQFKSNPLKYDVDHNTWNVIGKITTTSIFLLFGLLILVQIIFNDKNILNPIDNYIFSSFFVFVIVPLFFFSQALYLRYKGRNKKIVKHFSNKYKETPEEITKLCKKYTYVWILSFVFFLVSLFSANAILN